MDIYQHCLRALQLLKVTVTMFDLQNGLDFFFFKLCSIFVLALQSYCYTCSRSYSSCLRTVNYLMAKYSYELNSNAELCNLDKRGRYRTLLQRLYLI